MNQQLFEFYQSRKGYDMAIVIPGATVEPNPNKVPTQTPPSQPQ